MKKLFYLACIFMLLGLLGCAAMEPTIATHSLISKQSKEILIAKKDIAGKDITENEILTNLSKQLEKSGKYNYYNKTSARINGLNGYYLAGIKSNVSSSVPYYIELQFIRGSHTPSQRYFLQTTQSHYTSKERTDGSTLKAKFSVDISDNKDTYKIVLGYPSVVYEYKTWVDDHLAPLQNIINDLEVKFSSVDQLAIDRAYDLTGEVNSNYPADSVYSNYRRSLIKLSESTSNKDNIEKSGVFEIQHEGTAIRVSITVSPYRNGSKTVFSAIVPYKITNKLSVDQTYLDSLKNKIIIIANK